MSEFEQIPFGAGEFADNPEPRCPCLLLMDTSESMEGAPINELNRGLAAFRQELVSDPLAMKRVEIGMVTFGPVQLVSDFQTPDQFTPPALNGAGDTPMGAAITGGLEMIRQRKDTYKANGIPYYRPWIFLITDGTPVPLVSSYGMTSGSTPPRRSPPPSSPASTTSSRLTSPSAARSSCRTASSRASTPRTARRPR